MFVVLLTIVNDNPSLTVVNDDPSLTIVKIIVNKICFSKKNRFFKSDRYLKKQSCRKRSQIVFMKTIVFKTIHKNRNSNLLYLTSTFFRLIRFLECLCIKIREQLLSKYLSFKNDVLIQKFLQLNQRFKLFKK